MYFDSHAHYDDERFQEDRYPLLESMKENNIGYIMNACAELGDIKPILSLADTYPFLYASIGIHPHSVEHLKEDDMTLLQQATTHEKVKAIGEIGLDYYYDNSPRDLQRFWFARQIQLAHTVNLPVIIHDRDAHKDTIDILHQEQVEKVGGVVHCFAGSKEMAKDVLDMGMYVAFGGTLTFKNAVRPVEVAQYVPLDKILLETDSPYLAPTPHRGARNSSVYLPLVAERLAEIKGISVEEVERQTTINAKKCFGIGE